MSHHFESFPVPDFQPISLCRCLCVYVCGLGATRSHLPKGRLLCLAQAAVGRKSKMIKMEILVSF